MKEIESIVVEEIEQLFDEIIEELALREATFVAIIEKFVNEHVELSLLLIICQQSSNCSYHHSVRSHLK